ncbi:RNA polymerase Rpb3/Rpb11 dimerization domain-domain-containing protein [Absidia repens]|uniref:DNA-directed RNA polymerases I and III subunit RPAC2 n=1 Tax=Absidia repens TaxID=90262 RepID=A0A1X2ILN9_9FUNG|nr:RNA polymerase Rpb3/Rpb11 dimerization domain-domain-containing protein [Absidia repens]
MAASDASDSGSNHEDQTDVMMETEDYTEEQQGSDAEMDEDEDAEVAILEDKVEVLGGNGSDQTAMTFSLKNEDHTVGNSLRHMINKNPQVDFCGYSIPHPSEPKMHIRIQTSDKTTAVDAFRKGMVDLTDMCSHIRDTYEAELAKKDYTTFEEIA